MELNEIERFCFYCQDNKAECIRKVAVRRNNGFKLMDFDALLCKRCNHLDDKILSDYFSI
jgi:hypothetical protein